MKYKICQMVKVTDLNGELLQEVEFEHGELEVAHFSIGCSVITQTLGLKQFQVVYDRRYEKTQRCKIVDIEFSLVDHPIVTKAYLEPVSLIVGQHDIGEF